MAAGLTSVRYVLGVQHSGTTLLGNLLGNRPGYVSVGELRMAWRQWLNPDARCGCGELARACPFWREVSIERAAGDLGVEGAARVDARLAATRRLPALAAGRLEGEAAPLRAAYARLQQRVAAAAGAEVVVDTSKTPSTALLLERSPSADVRVTHLVRDSRGVLASHRRRGSPGFPARTLMGIWSAWNAYAEGAATAPPPACATRTSRTGVSSSSGCITRSTATAAGSAPMRCDWTRTCAGERNSQRRTARWRSP